MRLFRMVFVGNLIISLVMICGGEAAHAAYYSPNATATVTPEPEPRPIERYEMTVEFDEEALPLLADGDSTIDLRVKLIDNEAKVIKKLDFDLAANDRSLVGQLDVQRLRTEYLLTYTAPDITSTEAESASNTIIVYYRDADDTKRYKEIPIALRNKHFLAVTKAGFEEQKTAIDFEGPFAYLKVVTVTPEGAIIPVRGAKLEETSGQEILLTDEQGVLKIPNPKPAEDNQIKEFTVIMKLAEEIAALQRRVEKSYRSLASSEFAPSNIIIEEFIGDFETALAEAPDHSAGERMISGLYRLENIIYLLHRGVNTVNFVSQNIGKAARNQLWETVDLYDPISGLLTKLEQAVAQHSSDAGNFAQLEEILHDYPRHFVELASSVSGNTIALHTPELDENVINGFFIKLIDLVATKETSGREWGESWFQKAVINYFRERHQQFGEEFLSIVAEMVKKNSFQEHESIESLEAQREYFRSYTDRIMAEGRVADGAVIDAEKMQRLFLGQTNGSVGLLYDSLAHATENAFLNIQQDFIEYDGLAKWLYLYQLTHDETKTAMNAAAGFAKAATPLTPLVIPLVFADGPIYKHQHDPVMEKVSRYQLAVNSTIFYEKMLRIGGLLLKMNIDTDIVKLTVQNIEEKLASANAQVKELSNTIPKQFRGYDGTFQNESQAIPVPRIIAFVLLILSGFAYLGYSLFVMNTTEKAKRGDLRAMAPEGGDQERADS